MNGDAPNSQLKPNHTDQLEKDHQSAKTPSKNKATPDSPLSANFDPNRQAWHLLKSQIPGLLLTLLLILIFILTLVLSEQAGIVSHSRKDWFNAVTTILNLALGLNFLNVFRDMAKVLRWRVLASRSSTVRETDLILGGESLMKLWTLIRESRKKPITMLACVFWILFNLLAQATIAMLSLNYSMDLGSGSAGTYTVPGMISAPRLDCYTKGNNCEDTLVGPQTTAHSYGELIRGQKCCPYNTTADIFSARQSCPYFCSADKQQFAYRFKEYDPLDDASAHPYLSNRLIISKVEAHYEYHVDLGKSPLTDSPDGKQDTRFYSFHNNTYSGQIPIPNSASGVNSSTYVYNGTQIPQRATLVDCGPRCLTIYTLRLGTAPPGGILPATMFGCDISVSEVSNITAPWQEYPDDMARLAIASIALTGRNSTRPGMSWQQYQLYPWGNFLETNNLDAGEVGSNIANFTMGNIAATARLNQRVLQSSPTLPKLGYSPTIKWPYVIVLFVCIGVVHAVLVGLLCLVARPVVVCDDSDLTTARLLQGLVGRIPNGGGALLDGKALAEGIKNNTRTENHDGGEVGVVYGVIDTKDSVGVRQRGLGLSEDIQPLNPWSGAFPKGWYA